MQCLLIIGLPGSGKTHLAQNYISKGFELIDDPRDKNRINYCIKNKIDIVITDPHLCSVSNRKKAIDYLELAGYNVKCLFFENNIEKCKNNLKFRNDGKVIDGLESFRYVIPVGEIVMTIWQNE